MKTIQIIILSLSVLVSGTLLYVHYEIDKVQMDMQQSQIDHLKKTNEAQRDSLEKILKLKDDSLKIAFETIRTASAEREEAHKRSQATIRNLQKIIFVQHSDSSRTATLKELYKSYTP